MSIANDRPAALKDDTMVRLPRQIKRTDPAAPFTHEKHPVRLMLDIINEKAYIKATFRAGFYLNPYPELIKGLWVLFWGCK